MKEHVTSHQQRVEANQLEMINLLKQLLTSHNQLIQALAESEPEEANLPEFDLSGKPIRYD